MPPAPASPRSPWTVPLLLLAAVLLLALADRALAGLLVSLEDGAGHPLAGTDESWRIFHQRQLGILRGWLPLAGDERAPSTTAACWGIPPVGRWGRPRLGPPRPLLVDVTQGRPLPAPAALTLPPLGNVPPDRPQPPRRLFDWGREVAGYLLVDLPPADRK